MNIRQATRQDAEFIARLHAESWRIAYRRILSDEFLDKQVAQDRQDVWRQRFTAPKDNQMVLVAEANRELCGFVCAYGREDAQWGTFIDNLHVRPECRRQGIGRRLMREIARWSRWHYPDAGLYLSVVEANLPARRFYEALGAMNQESWLWEPPSGGKVTALRYVWRDLDALLSTQG